jgi:hypothetical protein
MNKAEKAAMEQLEIRAALCWCDPVEFDVIPDSYDHAVTGWVASGGGRVFEGWSTANRHGEGSASPENVSWGRGASQGARPMYSTRQLAIKAIRYERTRSMARELMQLDRMIAAEQAQ